MLIDSGVAPIKELQPKVFSNKISLTCQSERNICEHKQEFREYINHTPL